MEIGTLGRTDGHLGCLFRFLGEREKQVQADYDDNDTSESRREIFFFSDARVVPVNSALLRYYSFHYSFGGK